MFSAQIDEPNLVASWSAFRVTSLQADALYVSILADEVLQDFVCGILAVCCDELLVFICV